MSRITLTKLRADTQEHVKRHFPLSCTCYLSPADLLVLGDAVLQPPLWLVAVAEPLAPLQVSLALSIVVPPLARQVLTPGIPAVQS